MINLPLSLNQEFSLPQVISYQYQEWAFTPSIIGNIISFVGLPAPEDLVLATQIKNYIQILGAGNYRVRLVIGTTSGLNDAVVIAGAMTTASGLTLTQTNLNQNTTISFQNLEQVSALVYNIRLDHIVEQEISGIWTEVETESYYTVFERLGYNAVSVQPPLLNFAHQIGEALPAGKTITLDANTDFSVICGPHLGLSGGNLVQQSIVNGLITYTGSGSQEVTMTLLPSIEILGEQIPYYTSTLAISNGLSNDDVMIVRTLQSLQDGFQVAPLALEFTATKNSFEAPEKFVSLIGIGEFTVDSFPVWLTVTPSAGSNSQQIAVRPINSENLTETTYTGTIKITAHNVEYNVLVLHKVIGKYDLGFNPEGINFTDDRDTISTVNIPQIFGDVSRSVNLDIEALVFNYGVSLNELRSAAFKREIVSGKVSFYVGQIIKRIMFSLNDLASIGMATIGVTSFNSVFFQSSIIRIVRYYNPSSSSITLTVNNDHVTADDSVNEQLAVQFIKGRKPSRMRSIFGVLDYNVSAIRVTPSGYAMFNAYRSLLSAELRVYRNGVLHMTQNPQTQGVEVFGALVSFNEFTPGDVIEVRICSPFFTFPDTGDNCEYQKYIVFPEGNTNIHIGWENEHGVLELMQCTGDYSINTGYEVFSEKTFVNFLEKQQNYGFDKEVLFNINTGWILKENIDRINSLASSNKAWLYHSNTAIAIEMVPDITEVNNVASDQELYAFEIDFKINPTHEYQDYTF